MTELTKREKILIFLTVIILLVAGGFNLAIIPMHNRYEATSAEYDERLLEKELLEIKLSREAETREAHSRAKTQFQEISEVYPNIIPSDELDRLLTGLCLQNNLLPMTLGMSEPAGIVTVKELDTGEKVTETSAHLVTVTASMSVKGEYEQLKGLLDTVGEIEYIRLTKISYSEGVRRNIEELPSISLVFEIMMLNDIDYTAQT